MTWACELSEDAAHDLCGLPKAIQKRVARVLTQMGADPFQNDVKSLQNAECKGIYSRRLGDYRLLFCADHESRVISVVRILLRSEKTYR